MTPTHNQPATFDLSHEDAWVLHAALTSVVARALAAYLEDAPDRDRETAARLLDRVRTEL